jgi:hypothetical protein
MQAERVDRIVPIAGILFFVLATIGTVFALIGAPDFHDDGEEILTYYEDHDLEATVGVVLHFLAGVAFLFFLAGFRNVLRAAEGAGAWLANVAFAGGVGGLAVLAASDAPVFSAASRAAEDPSSLTAESAKTLFDLSGQLYLLAQPLLMAFIFASGIVIYRTQVLPRRLGWAGIVIGITLLVPPVSWATFGLLLIWVLVVSVLLLRRGVGAPATP